MWTSTSESGYTLDHVERATDPERPQIEGRLNTVSRRCRRTYTPIALAPRRRRSPPRRVRPTLDSATDRRLRPDLWLRRRHRRRETRESPFSGENPVPATARPLFRRRVVVGQKTVRGAFVVSGPGTRGRAHPWAGRAGSSWPASFRWGCLAAMAVRSVCGLRPSVVLGGRRHNTGHSGALPMKNILACC